ncbi:prolyl 4-hydroxylase, alpha subunit [Purpureocillium lilacinum]|uniref:Prolyl 4-hydroxylase, alpha subunit n=1 Tax=Purpureocillium lilacinum TaxID=33203 RepID=A0A179HY94_PURLI|nr:prolyl 4-hydroxylase, alpha subunit [Purpureocillium lilacinum]OAQ86446.1 prolyl 4-hydroxylase, alpha subunit [Purpureocillium lilacinum]OAQ94409.1 prolyl 4-hydroxylase, alpha subunit [Purpureocillium lilacinum]
MPKPKASSKQSKPGASTPQTIPTTSPPNWPQFKPPLPVVDLTPELHPATSKIALIPSFFPKSLCRDYVTFLKTLPLQTTPGRPKRGEAVRVNDRFQIEDHAFSQRLWEQTGLKEALLDNEELRELWGGEPVGLSPNIRIYRYSKGQYFDCHYDDYNTVTLHAEPPIAAKTTWTLLLYLTSAAEGCIGGETVFYPHDRKLPSEEIAVPLDTGMLLLHKHGDDCLLHEGREVKAGEKWVIRTDLCVRR